MSRGVIATLRDMVPIRPLTRTEAIGIAERQALRFVAIHGVDAPPVPSRMIEALPRVQVTSTSPLPVSGATQWSSGRWLILLNASEPEVRRNFSRAHELKHILDHRFVDIIYQGVPQPERAHWIEQVCDAFAAALLMPRPWVKRCYASGVQKLPALARQFGVSQAAMQVRLNQLGLVDPTPRCDRPRSDWALRAIRAAGSSELYQRRPGRVAASIGAVQ